MPTREQMMPETGGRTSRPAGPRTIWDAIARHAGDRSRPAISSGGRTVTYGDLAANVRATAQALHRLGVGSPDDHVGLLLPPGPAFFEAFLGAGVAGGVATVLQRNWSDHELAAALAVTRPRVVLVDEGRPAEVRRHAPDAVVVSVTTAGVSDVLDAAGRGTATPAPSAPDRPVEEEAPFYAGFTSGSTGRPKGFVRSHRSWLRSFEASEVFGIAAGDHVLAPGPLDHSLFLYAAIHGLSAGATVHVHRRFTTPEVLATLAAWPISCVYLVPTMLSALLRAADRGTRLTGVRTVICSGARWPAATLSRVHDLFPHAGTIDFYGASETSFISYRRPAPDDPPTCVGRPFPGVEVSVRRADGTPAPVGETGRLWVRSDMLFDGYLGADAGSARWDADGWLTIGDLAYVAADGRLHLVGREHAMLVSGGLNVFPEEVEDVLMQVPEVAEAALVGVPDDHWGHRLVAVVRWHPGRSVPRRVLRAHCRSHLARDKQPRRWLQVEDFPRTPSGKIARAELTARLLDGTLPARDVP